MPGQVADVRALLRRASASARPCATISASGNFFEMSTTSPAVVAVAVRDGDHVAPLGCLLRLGRLRVALQERVDVDALAAVRVETERRVSEPGECRHDSGDDIEGPSGPRAKLSGGMRRVLPGLLAIAAFYADGRGSHGLAFDALLGAIPSRSVGARGVRHVPRAARRRGRRGAGAPLGARARAARALVRRALARRPTAGRCRPLGASALVACLVRVRDQGVRRGRRRSSAALALVRAAKP